MTMIWIDMSVLLENSPLLRFTKNYIRDPGSIFSISVFHKGQWYTEWWQLVLKFVRVSSKLEHINFIFSWQEHSIELEIHKFSPPWNIFYILAFENFVFFYFHYKLAWRNEFYFRVITTILKPSFGRFSSNSRPVAQQMCSLCATSCLPDVSNVLKNDASNPEKKRKKFHPSCHYLLFCLFLADQIFYRSCVYRQHFRLRSFASWCFFILTIIDVGTDFLPVYSWLVLQISGAPT